MSKIKPDVGRTLYYYPTEQEGLAGGRGPLAAKIVWVHSENCVNLVVWDSNGQAHQRSSIELRDEPTRNGGCAAWMPWQLWKAATDPNAELTAEPGAFRAGAPQGKAEARPILDKAGREALMAKLNENVNAACELAAAGADDTLRKVMAENPLTLNIDPNATLGGTITDTVPVPDPNAPKPCGPCDTEAANPAGCDSKPCAPCELDPEPPEGKRCGPCPLNEPPTTIDAAPVEQANPKPQGWL